MLEIYWFDSLPSTQCSLIEDIKSSKVVPPVVYAAQRQPQGIGSRGNSWDDVGEALFFSCALDEATLPVDLPTISLSLYFGMLFKEELASHGSKVWLKWPNDLYRENQKIGGIITAKVGQAIVFGIGLNLVSKYDDYASCDIFIEKKSFLETFTRSFDSLPSWKQIFSKYRVEFLLNRNNFFHKSGVGSVLVSMSDAVLADDGALVIDGERIYSLR